MRKHLLLAAVLFASCGSDDDGVYNLKFEVLDVDAQCWRTTTESRSGFNYDDYVEFGRSCDGDYGINFDLYRTTYGTCELWPSCMGVFAFTDPVFHGDLYEPLDDGTSCIDFESGQPKCP